MGADGAVDLDPTSTRSHSQFLFASKVQNLFSSGIRLTSRHPQNGILPTQRETSSTSRIYCHLSLCSVSMRALSCGSGTLCTFDRAESRLFDCRFRKLRFIRSHAAHLVLRT